MELHTPGTDAEQTRDRQEVLAIIEDPSVTNLNARQVMLKWKQAHGSGRGLEFPSEEQIREQMDGLPNDYYVPIFGDGSLTSPTKWWAALGGYGV